MGRVGHLQIIDLSSETARQILKSGISAEYFNNITTATEIKPITLTSYATELSKALEECPLSVSVLRDTLNTNGYQKGVDPTVHSNLAFIEVLTRHL